MPDNGWAIENACKLLGDRLVAKTDHRKSARLAPISAHPRAMANFQCSVGDFTVQASAMQQVVRQRTATFDFLKEFERLFMSPQDHLQELIPSNR